MTGASERAEHDALAGLVERIVSAMQKSLDPSSGLVLREDRFLKATWPQVGEVHDLQFGPAHGTFFTAREPLVLEQRFAPPTRNPNSSSQPPMRLTASPPPGRTDQPQVWPCSAR